MVIFHSYVSLPEGTLFSDKPLNCWDTNVGGKFGSFYCACSCPFLLLMSLFLGYIWGVTWLSDSIRLMDMVPTLGLVLLGLWMSIPSALVGCLGWFPAAICEGRFRQCRLCILFGLFLWAVCLDLFHSSLVVNQWSIAVLFACVFVFLLLWMLFCWLALLIGFLCACWIVWLLVRFVICGLLVSLAGSSVG